MIKRRVFDMCRNSDRMYTYAYVACISLYGVGQSKYLYNFCKKETNVKVAWNLRWITDRCKGNDEGKVWWCDDMYKYLQIYMYIYNYLHYVQICTKSLVFSQENFLVGVTMFFFFLICFLIGKLYIGFSSQKVVELAIFGILGKLYT